MSCCFYLALYLHASIKTEEYMESELSSNFRVKMVAKNIVPGSLEAERWAVSPVGCLPEETDKCSEPDCWTLVFSLTSSILVWSMSKKSNLSNYLSVSFCGFPGTHSCGNIAKIFHAYQDCPAGNLWITKLVKFLLTTITEKSNFVFLSETCLIFIHCHQPLFS